MADDQSAPQDPLARKAEDAERLLEFIDRTTFAGDQREAADELSVVDQHPADVADITMQREVDYTIKGIVEEEVEQVQQAIQRQQEGRYGICADCNQPIAKERLEARPQATLCIDCQRKRESGRR
jgi:DnaK suppressor protein